MPALACFVPFFEVHTHGNGPRDKIHAFCYFIVQMLRVGMEQLLGIGRNLRHPF